MTAAAGSGRLDTLAAARAALGLLPLTDAEANAYPTAGRLPVSFAGDVVTVRLVPDPTEPAAVADFAQTVLLSEDGRSLAPRGRRRLNEREIPNAYWIVFGTIVEARDRSLAIGRLTIAPALGPELDQPGQDVYRGVTSPLLRLVSPAALLAKCVERLRASEATWGDVSDVQKRAQARVSGGRVPRSRVSDDEIEALARRYVELYRRGIRRGLLGQLAREHGLTAEQARDRIHRARVDGFLKPTTSGRVNAEPGPRLSEDTLWQPTRPQEGNDG